MFAQLNLFTGEADPENYPLGEKPEHADGGVAMAMVAVSHTQVERRLYTAMLSASTLSTELNNSSDALLTSGTTAAELFTVRRLMDLTGITSATTIRRGLQGLVAKFSAECEAPSDVAKSSNGNGGAERGVAYRVFAPKEVIARREEQGLKIFATGSENRPLPSLERVIQKVLDNRNLSHREAEVALCCIEGLTNAQIGARLLVTEQTVKFHMRNIFVKFGVKRRAQLIARLLM